MPRIANEGSAVSEWNARTGNGSSTWDVCNYCWRTYLDGAAPAEIEELTRYQRNEPEGTHFGVDVAHPPYDEQWPPYKCAVCEEPLTDREDDYSR